MLNSDGRLAGGRWMLAASLAALVMPAGASRAADAPDSLAAEAVGVIGSGDQLSLQLRPADGAPARVLKIGEVFEEGWMLSALDPATATLSKDGEKRQIGLNPAGALAAALPTLPVSQVDVTPSAADLILLEGRWDGKPEPGLTLAQTQRRLVYARKIAAATTALGGAAGLLTGKFTDADIRAQLKATMGEAAYEAATADYAALNQQYLLGQRQLAVEQGDINQVRVFDGLPVIGPDSFYIAQFNSPASLTSAINAAGLKNLVGYSIGPLDANGGRTLTKIVPPPLASQ